MLCLCTSVVLGGKGLRETEEKEEERCECLIENGWWGLVFCVLFMIVNLVSSPLYRLY
jgi:hypothetical protein